MPETYIIQKGRKVPFPLPASWNLLTFASPKEREDIPDIPALARKALRHPVGSLPLRRRVSASDRVAILIEDLTRSSPKGIVLRQVLLELEEARIPPRHITVVIALGTHRGLTFEELEAAFGADLVAGYRFVNHDCHAADLVPAAHLPSGREVRINRSVHEADFKIGIGSIFPHPMNGFGGGGKILFPGVADFDSIREHHFRTTFADGVALGKVDGNPFHDQVAAISREAGLDFIVNAVLDQRDEARDVVAGHPVAAHYVGIEKSRSFISHPFQDKADVNVITSFPYSEGPQIVKPLAPAAMVTREGGAIILCADLAGALPPPFVEAFARFHKEYGHDLMGGVTEHFRHDRLIMEGGAIDFNMALAMTLSVQHRFHTILLSSDIPQDQGEKMGFLYARDLDEAFGLAEEKVSGRNVHVIPSGGVILPVLMAS